MGAGVGGGGGGGGVPPRGVATALVEAARAAAATMRDRISFIELFQLTLVQSQNWLEESTFILEIPLTRGNIFGRHHGESL
jgi:hypothetical protein